MRESLLTVSRLIPADASRTRCSLPTVTRGKTTSKGTPVPFCHRRRTVTVQQLRARALNSDSSNGHRDHPIATEFSSIRDLGLGDIGVDIDQLSRHGSLFLCFEQATTPQPALFCPTFPKEFDLILTYSSPSLLTVISASSTALRLCRSTESLEFQLFFVLLMDAVAYQRLRLPTLVEASATCICMVQTFCRGCSLTGARFSTLPMELNSLKLSRSNGEHLSAFHNSGKGVNARAPRPVTSLSLRMASPRT